MLRVKASTDDCDMQTLSLSDFGNSLLGREDSAVATAFIEACLQSYPDVQLWEQVSEGSLCGDALHDDI